MWRMYLNILNQWWPSFYVTRCYYILPYIIFIILYYIFTIYYMHAISHPRSYVSRHTNTDVRITTIFTEYITTSTHIYTKLQNYYGSRKRRKWHTIYTKTHLSRITRINIQNFLFQNHGITLSHIVFLPRFYNFVVACIWPSCQILKEQCDLFPS